MPTHRNVQALFSSLSDGDLINYRDDADALFRIVQDNVDGHESWNKVSLLEFLCMYMNFKGIGVHPVASNVVGTDVDVDGEGDVATSSDVTQLSALNSNYAVSFDLSTKLAEDILDNVGDPHLFDDTPLDAFSDYNTNDTITLPTNVASIDFAVYDDSFTVVASKEEKVMVIEHSAKQK
jgi:hypothetical protein